MSIILALRGRSRSSHRHASIGAVNSAALLDSLHGPTRRGSAEPKTTGPRAWTIGGAPAVGHAALNNAKPQPARPKRWPRGRLRNQEPHRRTIRPGTNRKPPRP
eukprot:6878896-Pyramimonas_sp.AAC.1